MGMVGVVMIITRFAFRISFRIPVIDLGIDIMHAMKDLILLSSYLPVHLSTFELLLAALDGDATSDCYSCVTLIALSPYPK